MDTVDMYTGAVFDRVENFNRNRTGFGSFWPEPDCKPENVDRIRPDCSIFNNDTQLTNHKRKHGSFVL